MSGLGRCSIAPGLLNALLIVACTEIGAADHAPDSPESRLRARVADLHADVELLRVECAAARHNLLECLKKSGLLELGDRKTAVSKIKDEIRQLKMWGQTLPLGGSGELVEKLQRDVSKGIFKGDKEQTKLMVDFLKGGDEGEKALDRMTEIEYQGAVRFRSSRVGSQEGRFSQEDPIAAPEETGARRGRGGIQVLAITSAGAVRSVKQSLPEAFQ